MTDTSKVTSAHLNGIAFVYVRQSRTTQWEPPKWTAKLRELKTNDKLLLLKTNMGAGHAGVSGRFEYLKERAFEFAFVLKALGEV